MMKMMRLVFIGIGIMLMVACGSGGGMSEADGNPITPPTQEDDDPAVPPAQGSGSTYYVALSGDDGASGKEGAPFRTITYGVTQLSAGDTLIVRDGNYGDERVVISVSGTVDEPILIRAEHQGKAILNGPRKATEWDSDSGFGIFVANEEHTISYVTLWGFHVQNYDTGIYVEGTDAFSPTHITIEYCTLKNNSGDGVAFWKANDIRVAHSRFISGIAEGTPEPITDDYVLQDYGIGLYHASHILIEDNYFFGTHAMGVSFKYGCHFAWVKENIFEGAVSAAIFVGQRSRVGQPYCSNILVEKNIIRAAQGYELETPIRVDVVEGIEIKLNYLEGFATHSEEYGISIDNDPKGMIDIHDNIIAFGTIANSASGVQTSSALVTTPTLKVYHNTFLSHFTDVIDGSERLPINFKNNLSFQCLYHDESSADNFRGDPSFIDGTPTKQTEASEPMQYDFDVYYKQLTDPFKLQEGSAATEFGYRF